MSPTRVDVDAIAGIVERIRGTHTLPLLGTHALPFDERRDLTFNHKDTLPLHSNGMLFAAYAADGAELATRHLLLGGRRIRGGG